MGTTFIFLGAMIFAAHLFSAFFRRSRIPDVLFLVMVGILLGPVFGVVTPEELEGVGSLLASITLLFILVDSGIDIHIDDIRRYWVGMVQVTLSSFVLSTVVASITSHYLAGLEWFTALLLGSMVAGTGAAIVIPIIRQMKISKQTQTVLTLESALSGVLCIVVALALMEGFKWGRISFFSLVGNVFLSFFVALAIGIVSGIIWSGLLRRVRRIQNSMFMTPAFMFVIFGVAEALGSSGAIASLAFGIVLGNANYFEFLFVRRMFRRKKLSMQSLEQNEKAFFKEMVFILKTFFFVYIGISIPFTDTMALLYGLVIAAAIFIGRFILIMIVGRKNTKTDRMIVAIMAPKGLVSAVLAAMPHQINIAAGREVIPGAERLECMAYSIIFFSIILTSMLVLLLRKKIIDTGYKPEQLEVYDYE